MKKDKSGVCEECGRERKRVEYYSVMDKRVCSTCYKLNTEPKYSIPPHGTVGYSSEGKIICHECGVAKHSLSKHIKTAHGMDVLDYKEKHGINKKQSLLSLSYLKYKRDSVTPKQLANLKTFKKGHSNFPKKNPKSHQTIQTRTYEPFYDSCYIGLEREDGSVLYVYCYLGTPQEVAPILLEYYHHIMLVNQLVLLGDFPKIQPDMHDIKPYFTDIEAKVSTMEEMLGDSRELENNYRYIFTLKNEWVIKDKKNIFNLNFLVSEMMN